MRRFLRREIMLRQFLANLVRGNANDCVLAGIEIWRKIE
jgi:hypothetical protein